MRISSLSQWAILAFWLSLFAASFSHASSESKTPEAAGIKEEKTFLPPAAPVVTKKYGYSYHPVPSYKKPYFKYTPIYKHPLPPVPIYKPKPHPIPVYKPTPVPVPVYKPNPVHVPVPVPVYKPKPMPIPIYKPHPHPIFHKPPFYDHPIFKKPHPPLENP